MVFDAFSFRLEQEVESNVGTVAQKQEVFDFEVADALLGLDFPGFGTRRVEERTEGENGRRERKEREREREKERERGDQQKRLTGAKERESASNQRVSEKQVHHHIDEGDVHTLEHYRFIRGRT
jgi:hypothetical protein